MNRRILDGLFQHWNILPTVVSSGELALEALIAAQLAGAEFALVITDMHMPRMDGFGLVENIKSNPLISSVPVMMLSSGAQRGDGPRCAAAGISAYLLKPVRQSELRDAISRTLQTNVFPETSMITAASLLQKKESSKSMHILVAEDNLVNQKLAVALLQKRGHKVVLAENGLRALAILESTPFDLVLMDVQMPEMDGLEATRALRLREDPQSRRQPVVAMTALAMKGDRERCLAAGMDDYLSKPIRPQELDEMLDKYIMGRAELHSVKSSAIIASSTPKPTVEIKELLERVDGDIDLVAELLQLFRQDYPGKICAMREAISADDRIALRKLAHALEGALSNLSATGALGMAGSLGPTDTTEERERAQARLNEFDATLCRVVEALEDVCAGAAR